jgi:hypothetical protein
MHPQRNLIEAAEYVALNEDRGRLDHHIGNATKEITNVFRSEQELAGGEAPSLTQKRKHYGGISAATHISNIIKKHFDAHASEVGHRDHEKEYHAAINGHMDSLI